MDEHHFEEELREGKGKLDLVVESGRVDIQVHEHPTIIIDAETRHMDVTVVREDDVVVVRVEHEDGWKKSLFSLGKARATLNVYLPADCQVQAKTIAGTLRVNGVNAPVSARVVTGHTILEDLGGPVYAKTVTGNLVYRGLLVNEEHRFEATTGNIKLHLIQAPSARLDMRATTGSVRCDFPMLEQEQQRFVTGSKLRGTLGTGEGRIKAQVVTGSVCLESA